MNELYQPTTYINIFTFISLYNFKRINKNYINT